VIRIVTVPACESVSLHELTGTNSAQRLKAGWDVFSEGGYAYLALLGGLTKAGQTKPMADIFYLALPQDASQQYGERIIRERHSRTTAENYAFLMRELKKRGIVPNEFLIATDRIHFLRIALTLFFGYGIWRIRRIPVHYIRNGSYLIKVKDVLIGICMLPVHIIEPRRVGPVNWIISWRRKMNYQKGE
jgi:hypothetical protein